jgi:DNA-binding CsgD family transcriptional regulator
MVEIYDRIEDMNKSFFFNLKSKYPNLSDDDKRLASLLLIGLSSKEIANILNIEPKSVDMKRYRLKKRLNVESNIDIRTFLEKI